MTRNQKALIEWGKTHGYPTLALVASTNNIDRAVRKEAFATLRQYKNFEERNLILRGPALAGME